MPNMLRTVPILLLLAAATTAQSQDAAEVFKRAKGAVVTITTPTVVGTGFIIANGTLLVTSYHVIEGDPISGIRISLAGVRVASLLASDEEADVAIFRLTSKAPESLSLHITRLPDPGSKVFVIGTPLGFLSHTITEGIVSGVRPTAAGRLLQITAAISPGSSGSPVLDSSGRVVGMVKGSIEEGQALNFAVSAPDIRRVQSGAAQPSVPSLARPPSRTEGWPAGDARLADLASKLGSKEWGVEAARKLTKEGARAVPFLITALKVFEDVYDAQSRARDALVAIGKPAVEALIRAFFDREGDVGYFAGKALGQIGDARAVEPLLRALSDGDHYIRSNAAAVLGDIKDARAVAPLIHALSESEGVVGWVSAEALAKIGAPAVQPLIRALSDSNKDVRRGAARALGEIKDARAVAPLIRSLADSDEYVRARASLALEEIGAPAIPLLIRTLSDGDEDVCRMAVQSLAEMGAVAVQPLVRALSDSDKDVRRGAADALGEIKDARAVAPLIRALSDSDKDVRQWAARALGEIKDARAVAPLVRSLSDSDEHVRASAIIAMGKIGTPAVPPLIRALSDGDQIVRLLAALTLGEIKDERAVQPLIRALADFDEDVRRLAARALGQIKDSRAIEPLRRLLGDSDEGVREAAREAIRKIEG